MDWIFLIIVSAVFFIVVFTFTKGTTTLSYIFYFWVFCFNFGPRGRLIYGVKVEFIEGITWFIFVMIGFRYNLFSNLRKKVFPKYTILILLFFIFGFMNSLIRGNDFIDSIEEFKIFLLIIPTFYITYVAFKDLKVKFSTITNIFAVGTLILTIGAVVTYYFPSLTQSLSPPGGDSVLLETKETITQYTDVAYRRGGASFWGLFTISAYLFLLFFPLYVSRNFQKSKVKSYYYLVLCGLIMLTALINGHRSIWSGFLLGWAFFSLARGFKGICIGAMLLVVLVYFLPPEVIERFYSAFKPSDITWTGRVSLYEGARQNILQHPIAGVGLGGSGWVHNIAYQLAANLGVPGLLAFLLWIGNVFFRSFAVYRKHRGVGDVKIYHLAFLAGAFTYIGPTMGESVYTFPSFMIPFWFFLAVLYSFSTENISYEDKTV